MKVKIVLISLFLALSLTGCPDEPTQDINIGEVTITNIPAMIPVRNCAEEETRPTFKVYLNASNSMSHTAPPAAKGLVLISDATRQDDGRYTITMQLQQPNPDFGTEDYDWDPNLETGPWSGTAAFFSIMISPQDTTLTSTSNGVDAIWVKVGTALNIGKSTIDWDGITGMFDSRSPGTMVQDVQLNSLYDQIIRHDDDITSAERE